MSVQPGFTSLSRLPKRQIIFDCGVIKLTECCETCRFKYDLRKYDFVEGGCIHTTLPGFACMVFHGEAIWMHGIEPDAPGSICEGYEPKDKR